MSRPSRSSLLERESAIQSEVRAEIAKHKKEEEKKRTERQQREAISCWCGFSHENGVSLTEKRIPKFTLPSTRDNPPSVTLFVAGLPYYVSPEDVVRRLTDMLTSAGVRCKRMNIFIEQIPAGRSSHRDYEMFEDWLDQEENKPQTLTRHKGSGIITFWTVADAEKAIDALNGHELFSRQMRRVIRADFARPRTT